MMGMKTGRPQLRPRRMARLGARGMALACVLGLGLALGAPVPAGAEDASSAVDTNGIQVMYRLYNPNTGEHFYTSSTNERDVNASLGWIPEGVGWVAPSTSDTPVYRLYNPYTGDHHYTTSTNERDALAAIGWNAEGIGWYSGGNVAVYRQFNPYETVGTHNYTTSLEEDRVLASLGWHSEGIAWYSVADAQSVTTPIMGTPQNTVAQMVARYKSIEEAYPATALGVGGAPTIEDFCAQLYKEAVAEGVRPEVVFAQAMHETDWLRFGGDVKIGQFNFAGIGATGGGNPGNSFESVAVGLRAQVQHLKAYASTAPLNGVRVDPRFQYVTRGSAPTVEDLGGKWATDTSYGTSLRTIMNSLSSY